MVIPHLMFSIDRLIAYFRELPFIIITITRSKSARDPNRVNCMWQHTHRSAIKKQSKSCLGRGSFNFSFYWQISRYFCIIQEYKFPILPTLFFFFHNIHCVALNSSHEQLHEWPRRDNVFKFGREPDCRDRTTTSSLTHQMYPESGLAPAQTQSKPNRKALTTISFS